MTNSFAVPVDGPGKYAFVALGLDSKPLSDVAIFEVVDRSIDVVLEFKALNRADYLEVTIDAPKRALYGRIGFSMGISSSQSNRTSSVAPIKKGKGIFWVAHVDDSEVQGEKDLRYFVEVKTSLGTKRQHFDKVQNSAITIVFSEPCAVEVQVVGAVAQLNDKLRVFFRKKGEDKSGGSSEVLKVVRVNTFGKSSLQTGDYEFFATVKLEKYRTQEIAMVACQLGPGLNKTALTIPPLYSLVVSFPGENPGGSVDLKLRPPTSPIVERMQPVRRNKKVIKGKAEFEFLPAGTYVLRFQSRMDVSFMEIQIPQQREVKFEGKSVNCLHVESCQVDDLAYKAGLRTGDLIIGLNGKKIESLVEFQTAIVKGSEGGKFLILRAGQEIELKLDLIKLFESRTAVIRPFAH